MNITNKTLARAMMLMDKYNYAADCEQIEIAPPKHTALDCAKQLNNFIAILSEMEVKI